MGRGHFLLLVRLVILHYYSRANRTVLGSCNSALLFIS